MSCILRFVQGYLISAFLVAENDAKMGHGISTALSTALAAGMGARAVKTGAPVPVAVAGLGGRLFARLCLVLLSRSRRTARILHSPYYRHVPQPTITTFLLLFIFESAVTALYFGYKTKQWS